MSDQRLTSGTCPAPKRMVGRALTVVLSSVVLVAFGATAASARPTPANPPAVTGSVTTSAGGAVTVSATGGWDWPVGTGTGQINATAGTAQQECGGDYGVGWGIAWNDASDTGYTITYRYHGTPFSLNVGSKNDPDGRDVQYDTNHPCGSYSASALSGTWTATHTYPAGTPVPTEICVVSYVLKHPMAGHKPMYHVNTNRNNSFHTAVKHGHGSLAAFEVAPNCFDPASFKASPVIVTTATNAQVGSPITDSAVLSATAQSSGQVGNNAVIGNAAGTITFNLYGPGDTTCTSTPVYTTSVQVSGNGTYGPATFTPTQGAGAYQWIATYSGDPNNNGATEVCGAAGETSTVSPGPATTPSNPPTSPTSSVPVVTTAATGSLATAAVSGATTVHTGEPWAGSGPFVVGLIAFGLSLMGLGYFQRRRFAFRTNAENDSSTTD